MAIPSSEGWETDEWQAWFERLLGKAVSRLEDLQAGKGNAAKRVHETRKVLKRLRTGTRLLRGFAKGECLREAKVKMRDAARLLAGSRDGTVRLNTFDSMMEMSGKKVKGRLAQVRQMLKKEAVEAKNTAGDGADEALELLESIDLSEAGWRFRGKNDVKKNLARILGRAQKQYAGMADDDEDEEFHELRKRVKDLFYSLGALPGEATGARKRVNLAIHVFEESLGLFNDLAVLMEWFENRGMGPENCPEFWDIATPAMKEFRKLIIEEGVILDELAEKGRYRKVFLGREERVGAA